MRRFFTRTAFRNRPKQVSENKRRNGFRKALHTRAKMTSYVKRVFRSVGPLKQNSLIKANEEISVMWALGWYQQTSKKGKKQDSAQSIIFIVTSLCPL